MDAQWSMGLGEPISLTPTIWLPSAGFMPHINTITLLTKQNSTPIGRISSLREGWAICLKAPYALDLWLSLFNQYYYAFCCNCLSSSMNCPS